MLPKTEQIIRELIEEYSLTILEDPDRLSQFLEDRCPECSADNFKITFALRCIIKYGWNIHTDLSEINRNFYEKKLCEKLAFREDEAKQVMEFFSALTEITIKDGILNEEQENNGIFVARAGNLKKISGGLSDKPRTMWLRKKSIYNGIVLLSALLAIVVLFFQIGRQRDVVGNEFRIAYFAYLDGDRTQAGRNQLKAAQLALEPINKHGGIRGFKVKIIGYNLPKSADMSSAKVQEVIKKDQSILMMITSVDGEALKSVCSVADEYEIPLIVTTEHVTNQELSRDGKAYLYSFRLANSSDDRAKMTAYFANGELGMKRIAVLYDSSDEYSVTVHDSLTAWLKTVGTKIITDIGYTEENVNDLTIALKAIKGSNADGMVLCTDKKNNSDIVLQARSIGYEGRIISHNYIAANSGSDNFLRNSWWINEITQLDPQIRSVLKDYEKLYNEQCPLENVTSAMLTYDGVRWACAALYRAPGYRGETIRHALLSTRNTPLTHATLTVDPRTHAPLNKAAALIYCANRNGIFQRRISPKKIINGDMW